MYCLQEESRSLISPSRFAYCKMSVGVNSLMNPSAMPLRKYSMKGIIANNIAPTCRSNAFDKKPLTGFASSK